MSFGSRPRIRPMPAQPKKIIVREDVSKEQEAERERMARRLQGSRTIFSKQPMLETTTPATRKKRLG